ncbi:MAG: hypothetical protein V2A62_01065 [Candidatus Woesearchaeota archaeon]
MADKEVQKVKITGGLWTFRNVLGIIKDILMIILLLILIGGAITLITVVPNLIQTMNTLPNLMQTMQEGGPEALVQEFQNDVNSGNWDGAMDKLNAFETAGGMMDLPPEAKVMIQELKQAVQQKDKNKVNQILAQMDDSGSNSGSKNNPSVQDYRENQEKVITYG